MLHAPPQAKVGSPVHAMSHTAAGPASRGALRPVPQWHSSPNSTPAYPNPSAAHEVMQDAGVLASATTVVTSPARIRAGLSIAQGESVVQLSGMGGGAKVRAVGVCVRRVSATKTMVSIMVSRVEIWRFRTCVVGRWRSSVEGGRYEGLRFMCVGVRDRRGAVDHAVRAHRQFQFILSTSVRVKGARSKNPRRCGRSARLAGKDTEVLLECVDSELD